MVQINFTEDQVFLPLFSWFESEKDSNKQIGRCKGKFAYRIEEEKEKKCWDA
jgi:hypothetical protein